MAKSIANVDMIELGRAQITIKVSVERVKEFRVRLWLAMTLLRLVKFIAPAKVEIVS